MSTKSSESAPRSAISRLCGLPSSGLRTRRSATKPRITSRRSARVSVIDGPPVAQQQGSVLAAEAEGVGQDVTLFLPAGLVGHVIEVAGRVRLVQVDSRV